MRTITIEKEVFKFDELSEQAKNEVRFGSVTLG